MGTIWLTLRSERLLYTQTTYKNNNDYGINTSG